MAYSLAFHIIGIVFWLGGLAMVTRYMQVLCVEGAASASPALDAFRYMTKRIWYGFVVSGLVIATVSGLYQFLIMGAGYYMKQGWFHGKLTLLVVLYVISWLVGKEVRKTTAGAVLQKKRLVMLHGISSLILVLIVFLTLVGRTGG
ncbi:MAG: CopD family protein [Deltaproteobacteria bacterium]|nr:CopD family protein [Deltaproteobacteria bacterium]